MAVTPAVPSANTATINCAVIGAPSSGVTYQWLEAFSSTDRALIDDDTVERVPSTTLRTLTITNVGVQDEDMYACVVSVDGIEVGSDISDLTVVCKWFCMLILVLFFFSLNNKLMICYKINEQTKTISLKENFKLCRKLILELSLVIEIPPPPLL